MRWTPTDEQREIISHDITTHGRVLAGPGTGKSATVVQMMLKMAEEDKGDCKLLTFTRAATNELRDKVTESSEPLGNPSTVHSFAINVLLKNCGVSRLPEPIRIADDWEWEILIRFHLKELVGCGVRVIDQARKEMASNWESMEQEKDPNLPDDIRNRFAGVWEQHRTVFGYSLLAELPYRLLHALQNHPDMILGDWRLIIVDEYQDLNKCDLLLLKEITRRGLYILAVGDDDQSIYSFRLAHPIGIQRFCDEYYPGAADYTLSISQRCGSSILRWARHVIEGLPNRPIRRRLSSADHCTPGEVAYLGFEDQIQEIEGVAKLVKWIINSKDIDPEDVVILFRTNYNNIWSKPIIETLQAFDIPVVNPDIVNTMLKTSSNRRMLAMARLIVNQEDSLAWWTILELTRGIGPSVRNHFYDKANASQIAFGKQIITEYRGGFTGFQPAKQNLLIQTIKPIHDLISDIDESAIDLRQGGWGNWLTEQADILGECENDFKSLLIDLDDIIDRREGLGRFISQIQPVGKDLRSGRGAGAVRLMTMMSSKGLTVRATIIVGAEEGIIPLSGRDKQEERRLLYVAMTRSTDFLYLTWSRRRTGPTARTGIPNVGERRTPSSFLTHGFVRSKPGDKYLCLLGV